jgi:hypothetical protein
MRGVWANITLAMTVEPKRRKIQKPQLKVVFETNVLYNGSASDLVQQEASNLIAESVFPDLEIQWYLPEIVRHERQYQMQKRALELLLPIAKVEKLLGHNLAITEQILLDSVQKAVAHRQAKLGLLELHLDLNRVDWNRVALDAVYRKPPFQDGEKEKGFRDSMIVECFLQLLEDSPKTPETCRVVLVSNDKLLTKTVQSRCVERTNSSVLSSLEELKGLINTLVSRVDETFLASIRSKAGDLFFLPDTPSTLFYKEQIKVKLKDKFAADLGAIPPGATSRTNGTWLIHPPNFVKKNGRRIHWASRILIEADASKIIPQSTVSDLFFSNLNLGAGEWTTNPVAKSWKVSDLASYPNVSVGAIPSVTANLQPPGYSTDLWANAGSSVVTHKGSDVYEVLWSVDVTTSRGLRRASIDELKHLEPKWEQVT